MKNSKKIKILLIIFAIFMLVFSAQEVTASNNLEVKEAEYTEEYQKWLNLPKEEREKTLQPRKYNIISSTNYLKSTDNIFKIGKLLRSTSQTKYSLNDENVIKDNVKIKNQGSTNSCWAFAYIGALETNLAMQDKNNSNPLKIYDFSERHMIYSSYRNAFLNNEINENGHTGKPSQGGTYTMAEAYLSNGSGAINEDDMKFVNSEADMDINDIKNKNVVTTLYDSSILKAPTTDTEKSELMLNMKSHISTYGGIYAAIHGAQLMSDYYNNKTGAIYCNNTDANIDHAVLIIGWDDNYSKDNFNEKNKPTNNGAWIIKNSWGEKIEISLDDIKEEIYTQKTQECQAQGWNSASEIPDAVAIQMAEAAGYTVENNIATMKVGDNGYMYISYEDIYVYSELIGVQKSKNEKDYSKVYQNDILGVSKVFAINDDYAESKVYLANVFNRENTKEELIDKISINTIQEYKNCKVYINPNGAEKSKESLKEVALKSGETVNIKPGYHVLEFANPQVITGNNFVVAIEFDKNTSENLYVSVESVSEGGWEDAVVNANESFYTTDTNLNNNTWGDMAPATEQALKGNNTIKAYVAKEGTIATSELSGIAVTKQPTKVEYKVGEDFDSTGMEVTATYSNGEKKVINNYEIKDGTKLAKEKTSVTISYTENSITKTTEQPITVTENSTTPGGDKEPDKDKEPKPSDFQNAKGDVKSGSIYTYKELNKEPYCELTIKVTNIKIGDEDDKYTYYYCLAVNKNTSDIKDEYWVEVSSDKIKKESDGTYSMTLDISSKDLKNIDDLSNADDCYLFIKEVAEINGKKVETINNVDVTVDIEPDIYVDDQKVGNINIEKPQNGNQNNNYTGDGTTADKKLPNTGNLPIIIGVIVLIALVGGFAHFRYKHIDK